MKSLESYFEQFRKGIVGIDSSYNTVYGDQKIIYADWIASGRLYKPIEQKILAHLWQIHIQKQVRQER